MDNDRDATFADYNTYFLCPSCGEVVLDCERTMEDIRNPALCCGSRDVERANWPAPYVRAFLKIAFEQNLHSYSSLSTAILSLNEALALLLEGVLWRLVNGKTGSLETARIKISSCPDMQDRITLYDLYSDVPIESLLESKGLHGFFPAMEYIWRQRTLIVQSSARGCGERGITAEDIESIDRLSMQCLKAFSYISNDVNRQIKAMEEAEKDKKMPSVLVVDDDEYITPRLSRFLTKQGLNVRYALKGSEAVELYKKHSPDYVFLDVMLPDTDGLIVLDRIREFDPGARVYFLTGVGGESFKKEAIGRGAQGSISKPVDLAELMKIIREQDRKNEGKQNDEN
jgi:CheY-like chemotaxis protein